MVTCAIDSHLFVLLSCSYIEQSDNLIYLTIGGVPDCHCLDIFTIISLQI